MTALAKSVLIGAAVLVLLAIMAVGAFIIAGIYGWQAAQRAGNEAAAVQDLKTIRGSRDPILQHPQPGIWNDRTVDQGKHVSVQVFGRQISC